MVRWSMRVTGMVQGVGFRYFVKYTANLYGLTGWVRNRQDGDVELEAQGEVAGMEAFLAAVREGSHYSDVQNVEIHRLQPVKEYYFTIEEDA